ncbi:CngA, partial [Symbiodinium microadriaticum]
NHWMACAWFGVSWLNADGENWVAASGLKHRDVLYQYLSCILWSFAQLGVGEFVLPPTNSIELLLCAFIAFRSLITAATLISTMGNLIAGLRKIREDETSEFRLLRRFLKHNNIPHEVGHKVTQFLQHQYSEKQQSRSADVRVPLLDLLSPPLFNELCFERYRDSLCKLKLVDDLLEDPDMQTVLALHQLARSSLTQLVAASGDVIFLSGKMERLLLLRPSCSEAVRHQARLEMVFLITPWLGAMGSIISRFDDDAAGRFDYVAVIHLVGATVLITVGMILYKTNCLPSAAHYLEDPSCSSALCGWFSWLPMVATCPTLMTGGAQDIVVTCVDWIGAIILYVPLVEEPLSLMAAYVAYGSLAWARVVQLHLSEVDSRISVTPYFCRLIAVVGLTAIALQIRIRYLSLKGTPLTPDCLEARARTQFEADEVLLEQRQMLERFRTARYVQFGHGKGVAADREREVWSRRRLYKAELTGRLLWAIHLHRQSMLSSEVLDHILTFLYEPIRPVVNCIGLLADDGTSMISSTQDTVASSGVLSSLSSLSSVAALRKALSARQWLAFERPPCNTKSEAAESEQAGSGNGNALVPSPLRFMKYFRVRKT